jgi:hypothetical protein
VVADPATAIARPREAYISRALPTITAVAAFPCGMKSHRQNDPYGQNVAMNRSKKVQGTVLFYGGRRSSRSKERPKRA